MWECLFATGVAYCACLGAESASTQFACNGSEMNDVVLYEGQKTRRFPGLPAVTGEF